MRQVRNALGEAVLAALVAVGVAAVGLAAFSLVQWPSFNSSNETRALTTVGQVCCLALLGGAVAISRWSGARRLHHQLGRLSTWVGLSGFVTVTLGLPLGSTKLYLLGVSVDQEFRTEYLTRLTDSAKLHDMTYADLPPFYPAGWFWVGGRAAHLLGLAGWEIFKPYAITSIAVAAVVAFVLWSRLVRRDFAIMAALAATATEVAFGSPEPYGAIIAVLLPPALILAWGALHRPMGGGWGAAVGTGLFLGFAATYYTLYLAVAAAIVVLMALIAAGIQARAVRSWHAVTPVAVRLGVIAAVAGGLSLLVWLPFLFGLRKHRMASSGTAFHYLPEAGAQLPFPMLQFSLLGGLCLIGTLWLVLRASSSRRAQALGVGVVAVYLWSLGSMAATVLQTTLLSFRLQSILVTLLAVAGVFGFVEGARAVYQALNEPARLRVAVLVVGAAGALAFSQDIPHVLVHEIDTAYTDTDGNGNRGDQRPSAESAVWYYRHIDRTITERTHRNRHDTVVLTGDTSFLSFYPYYGFQARTSHYANPMGDYTARDIAINRWSHLETPEQLIAALDKSRWRAPDVFLFRRSGDDYTLRLAVDVYPNDPNVKRYTVSFPKKLFDANHFTTKIIGPFAVVVRK